MDMRVWAGAVERAGRDDGQDLMEYALLVALVVVVAVGTITTVGSTVRDVFWKVIADGIP